MNKKYVKFVLYKIICKFTRLNPTQEELSKIIKEVNPSPIQKEIAQHFFLLEAKNTFKLKNKKGDNSSPL